MSLVFIQECMNIYTYESAEVKVSSCPIQECKNIHIYASAEVKVSPVSHPGMQEYTHIRGCWILSTAPGGDGSKQNNVVY